MPATVSYREKDGNTVPYPPLFNGVRQNHGYFETRGKPENVALIPEAQRSDALRHLLLKLASPQTSVASLGCDLGEYRFPKRRLSRRWQAGGYVQILPIEEDVDGHAVLRPLAKTIEQLVKKNCGQDNWEVELVLAPVLLQFGEEQYARSVWVWFHALASSRAKAIASREKLIHLAEEAVQTFHRHRATKAAHD